MTLNISESAYAVQYALLVDHYPAIAKEFRHIKFLIIAHIVKVTTTLSQLQTMVCPFLQMVMKSLANRSPIVSQNPLFLQFPMLMFPLLLTMP